VSGQNEPGKFCSQATTLCSQFINASGIGNSISLTHESIFVYKGMEYNNLANIATVPFAAAITLGAHIDGPLAVQMALRRRP
jgi:hypothetical protein